MSENENFCEKRKFWWNKIEIRLKKNIDLDENFENLVENFDKKKKEKSRCWEQINSAK